MFPPTKIRNQTLNSFFFVKDYVNCLVRGDISPWGVFNSSRISLLVFMAEDKHDQMTLFIPICCSANFKI